MKRRMERKWDGGREGQRECGQGRAGEGEKETGEELRV